jgi:hypothetical protein
LPVRPPRAGEADAHVFPTGRGRALRVQY